MPSPLPYRPHFHQDWISSTSVKRMSYAARGMYLELLDSQWADESIPEDPEDVRAMLRPTDLEWLEFLPHLDRVFPVRDGVRRNPRCAAERESAVAKVEKNRHAGSLGGRARVANANQTPSERLSECLTERSSERGSESQANQITITDKPLDIPIGISVPKGTRSAFKPPTLEELTSYMAELGLPPSFPQKFLDYYLAQGWKLSNGVKMVDWKAACRNWKSKETDKHKPHLNGKPKVEIQPIRRPA